MASFIAISAILAIWFKGVFTTILIEPAVECSADKDCSGFLVKDDGTSIKVKSGLLIMAMTQQTLWPRYLAGEGVARFNKVPEKIASKIRSEALSLGFDKEIKYEADGMEFSRFYKVYKDLPRTYLPAIDRECYENHGLLPQANMTERGLRLLYQTLLPDALSIPIGLRKYLVSDSVYRLTWNNGLVLGEGTTAQYNEILSRDFGLVNKQPDEDNTRYYGYIESKGRNRL